MHINPRDETPSMAFCLIIEYTSYNPGFGFPDFSIQVKYIFALRLIVRCIRPTTSIINLIDVGIPSWDEFEFRFLKSQKMRDSSKTLGKVSIRSTSNQEYEYPFETPL